MRNSKSRWLVYEIRVAGELGAMWGEWFDGFEIRQETDPATGSTVTVLTGAVQDQPKLHSILNHLGGLNLTLLGVEQKGIRPSRLDNSGKESSR